MGIRPDVASRPTSPDPGATGRSDSSSTAVVGPTVNDATPPRDAAPEAPSPGWVRAAPCTPDSDEPMPSVITQLGKASTSRARSDDDRGAAPLPMAYSDE